MFIQQNPEFFFPKNKREQMASAIKLCDIPFVRVRGWYEKEYSGVPPSYMTLVRRMQGLAPEPVNYPKIYLDVQTGGVEQFLDATHPGSRATAIALAIAPALAAARRGGGKAA